MAKKKNQQWELKNMENLREMLETVFNAYLEGTQEVNAETLGKVAYFSQIMLGVIKNVSTEKELQQLKKDYKDLLEKLDGGE